MPDDPQALPRALVTTLEAHGGRMGFAALHSAVDDALPGRQSKRVAALWALADAGIVRLDEDGAELLRIPPADEHLPLADVRRQRAGVVDKSAHISFRVHADLVARLDALVPLIALSSTLCPTGKADRTDVIRHTLEAGLAVLERRHLPPRD